MGDSIKALGNGTNLHFTTPIKNLKKDQAAVGMAETLKAWSTMKWDEFGFNLGKLLQALVTVVFPQKYMLDDSGALRMRMLADSEQRSVVLPKSMSRGIVETSAKIITLALSIFFAMLMLLRTYQT